MRRFAICGVGRDRPGIVAGLTGALLRHGVNIEDSQATILRGHFTLMLVVAAPSDADADALRADLDGAGREVGLEALLVSEIEAAASAEQASHIVTVYGADHTGIVHAVTAALAERGVDITDLRTRLSDTLYVLLMEILPAAGGDPAELEAALARVAAEQGVELTLRPLDADPL